MRAGKARILVRGLGHGDVRIGSRSLLSTCILNLSNMFSQNVREEDPDLTELRKSSERKDPNAMFRLGAELYDGGRVPQDRTEALRLWREAADL